MKPKWLEIALKEVGVCEVKGGENKRIIEYHATTTLKAKEDEVPWCSSFVNWCMVQAGLPGTNSAAARSWLGYGMELDEPREGCICVIQQKVGGKDPATGSTSGFHVGFYIERGIGRVRLLGGNQSDSVKESGFGLASYKVVSYRWPHEVK